jgi:putative Mg2+ transporter-C (MgtC) family protein
VRTLGLVCLGSALAVLSIHAATGTEESRVIQGIVTGVGFLGAGVIVRSEKGRHPSLTGSSPTPKTIGIVVVAALAANAEAGPPGTAITATRRCPLPSRGRIAG